MVIFMGYVSFREGMFYISLFFFAMGLQVRLLLMTYRWIPPAGEKGKVVSHSLMSLMSLIDDIPPRSLTVRP